MDVYVEVGVGGHIDDAVQAWSFDIASWGRCGQGTDEPEALDHLRDQVDGSPELVVAERIRGDEKAFARDVRPASAEEYEATLNILGESRAETIRLVSSLSDTELDFVDPERTLPSWATWNSMRQMAWHVADTESRYYLARLGETPPERCPTVLRELQSSHLRVAAALRRLPADVSLLRDRLRHATSPIWAIPVTRRCGAFRPRRRTIPWSPWRCRSGT